MSEHDHDQGVLEAYLDALELEVDRYLSSCGWRAWRQAPRVLKAAVMVARARVRARGGPVS